MAIRFEDRGLTLRLFRRRSDVMRYPGGRSPVSYGAGWIGMDDTGQWIDSDGVLPAGWQPDRDLVFIEDGNGRLSEPESRGS